MANYPPYYSPYPYQAPTYPNFQQPAANAQNAAAQPGTISGRMVSCREEALAVPADFLGNPVVMPDFSHGKIYVKILNTNTGAGDLIEFQQANASAPPQYATKEDVEQLRAELSAVRAALPPIEKEANG